MTRSTSSLYGESKGSRESRQLRFVVVFMLISHYNGSDDNVVQAQELSH